MTYTGPVKPGTSWRSSNGTLIHLCHYDLRAKKWVYVFDRGDERDQVSDVVLRRRYELVGVEQGTAA